MQPLLSILLPTYEYAAGVERILAAIGGMESDRVEVLVGDDSGGDAVERVVRSAAPRFPRLRYRRNVPRMGACANWNGLLDDAVGEYCLLLHHDEYPEISDFVPRLFTELLRRDADVLVLGCVVRGETGAGSRQAAPRWLRSAVLERCPGYLCFRNVLGAPSVLVVRRAAYPRFDPRLSWLIDVEAYVRLFASGLRVRFVDELVVASVIRARGSITRSLAADLRRVHRDEIAYVTAKHPQLKSVRLLGGSSPLSRAARLVETAAWAGLRAAQIASIAVAAVHGRSPPPAGEAA